MFFFLQIFSKFQIFYDSVSFFVLNMFYFFEAVNNV